MWLVVVCLIPKLALFMSLLYKVFSFCICFQDFTQLLEAGIRICDLVLHSASVTWQSEEIRRKKRASEINNILHINCVKTELDFGFSEMAEKAPLRIVVTGAAGQIAYSLLYQVGPMYFDFCLFFVFFLSNVII